MIADAPEVPIPGPDRDRSPSPRRSLAWRLALAAGIAPAAWAITAAALPSGTGPAASLVGSGPLTSDRLFLGRAIPGGGAVDDEAWEAFSREEVAPRFPDGLTVWKAEGRWADPRGAVVREPVIVLEVIHPGGPEPDASVREVARRYKARFRQDAILHVRTRVDASLR